MPVNNSSKILSLWLTCPKGLEYQLQSEAESFGLKVIKSHVGKMDCEGQWPAVIRMSFMTRFANRMILQIVRFEATDKTQLLHELTDVSWFGLFAAEQSFAVNFKGTNNLIKHSHYGALLVKDAIVDSFKQNQGTRPSINADSPDVVVYAKLNRKTLDLGLDLIGKSLHQRGYRLEGAKAPLKENLAAALINRLGPLPDSGIIVDPMCGSGTLLIEAVAMQLGLSAQTDDADFLYPALKNGDQDYFNQYTAELKTARQQQLATPHILAYGFDQDPEVVAVAKANVARAGLSDFIQIQQRALKDFILPKPNATGFLVVNPPYGERIGHNKRLFPLYQQLGSLLKQQCPDFSVGVLCNDGDLFKAMGLQKSKSYQYFNGALPVTWNLYQIHKRRQETDTNQDERFQQGVEMIVNRLKKNQKQLQKWINQQSIEAYRVYDADMPEYAFCVDRYGPYFHVSEYKAPKQIDPFQVTYRREQFLTALEKAFSCSNNQIHLKERAKQKGQEQYQKLKATERYQTIKEQGVKIAVNLYDYLDTGLFLDHRPVRRWIGEKAKDKRFLNLYAYTGVATLHAAMGGAKSTTSVDLSKTYLKWCEKNFVLNRLNMKQHRLVNDDCFHFLKHCQSQFDLIFLDPPSFSNSKKMQSTLDVQRDHATLIDHAMALLANEGELIFSTNLQSFTLAEAIKAKYEVNDITAQSFDPDFKRNQKIHQCFILRHVF